MEFWSFLSRDGEIKAPSNQFIARLGRGACGIGLTVVKLGRQRGLRAPWVVGWVVFALAATQRGRVSTARPPDKSKTQTPRGGEGKWKETAKGRRGFPRNPAYVRPSRTRVRPVLRGDSRGRALPNCRQDVEPRGSLNLMS